MGALVGSALDAALDAVAAGRSDNPFSVLGCHPVVVNGQPVASRTIPADGQIHEWRVPIRIDRSSWVALRQFPQLHTNPVNVLIAEAPIRASRRSASGPNQTRTRSARASAAAPVGFAFRAAPSVRGVKGASWPGARCAAARRSRAARTGSVRMGE